jgi:hypothetical protein
MLLAPACAASRTLTLSIGPNHRHVCLIVCPSYPVGSSKT